MTRKNQSKQAQHHLFPKKEVKIQQFECKSCPANVTHVRLKTFPFLLWNRFFPEATIQKRSFLSPHSAKKTWLLQLCRLQQFFWCWCAVSIRDNGPSLRWNLHQMEATMIFSPFNKSYNFLFDTVCENTQLMNSATRKNQLFLNGRHQDQKQHAWVLLLIIQGWFR